MAIIEKIIYFFRDLLWIYPNRVIFDSDSLLKNGQAFYKKTRPFSHLLLGVLVYVLISSILFVNVSALLGINQTQYVEGSVVGIDENGEILGLKKINPLIQTNIQLEKDISNLIYESLVRVNQENEVVPILVQRLRQIKAGNHYAFELKHNVKWHDGEELTTADVKATLDLLRRLNEDTNTSSNFSSVAANQLDEVIIIDKYNFELKLKSEDAVLPTFFESISFKIMPAKYIEQITSTNILTSEPNINVFPIGTGPFRYSTATRTAIKLVSNNDYYLAKPRLEEIVFKLFKDEESAVRALNAAQIHGIAGLTSNNLKTVADLKNYQILKSNVIYNQYWGVYFNLDADRGNPILQNVNVRKAIAYAVNRDSVLASILWQGEASYSTIPSTSFAYSEDIEWIKFNQAEAIKILETDGWIVNPQTGVREKDGQALEFDMVYVDNFDRNLMAKVIESNLKDVGIKLNIQAETISSAYEKYILPRSYEILLFGQTTFIDPDRYELFHSSQSHFPDEAENSESSGLNITKYVSNEQVGEIRDQELIRTPKVDKLLEDGRSILNKKRRAEVYEEFQEILNNEVPVIVLYHPTYTYVVSKRVNSIELKSMNNLENRFDDVVNWRIDLKD